MAKNEKGTYHATCTYEKLSFASRLMTLSYVTNFPVVDIQRTSNYGKEIVYPRDP